MRLIAALAILVCASAWGANPPGTAASRAALARCQAAEDLPERERRAVLEDSLRHADVAIAADPTDALAHFAAFCALGRLLRVRGVSLAAPGQIRRLRREVDRTLELAPDFAVALAGKGALLLGLPRLLGGDAAEGERLLRRALEVDPTYLRPRLALVEALRARHADAEARVEAELALAIAERKRSLTHANAAREQLRALGQTVP